MRILRRIRIVLLTLLIISVALPATMYVVLSARWAQQRVRDVAQAELSQLLDTRVEIGDVHIVPFNRLTLDDVTIYDENDSIALYTSQVSARFELLHFIRTGSIIIDYARIRQPQVNVYRRDNSSPLNIDRILRALKGEDKDKPPTRFALRIENAIIEDGTLRYDVMSQPVVEGQFDKNHICVTDLNINIFAPMISDRLYVIDLDRLSLKERSGLEISNLRAHVEVTGDTINVGDLELLLPESLVAFAPLTLTVPDLAAIATPHARPLCVSLLPDSYVTPADLRCFMPSLAAIDTPFDLSFDVCGTLHDLEVKSFGLSSIDGSTDVSLSAHLHGLDSLPSALRYEELNLKAELNYAQVRELLEAFAPRAATGMAEVPFLRPSVRVDVEADGSLTDGYMTVNISTPVGAVKGDVVYNIANIKSRTFDLEGSLNLDKIRLSTITGQDDLGRVDGRVDFNLGAVRGVLTGDIDAEFGHLEYRDNIFDNITARGSLHGDSLSVVASVDDAFVEARVNAFAVKNHLSEGNWLAQADVAVGSLRPDRIGVPSARPGYAFSGNIHAWGEGVSIDSFKAYVHADNLCYRDSMGNGLDMKMLKIDAQCAESPMQIDIVSDYLNGSIQGEMALSTLPRQAKELASRIFPAYIKSEFVEDETLGAETLSNDFVVDLRLSNGERLSEFFSLPVKLVYPIDIEGAFDYGQRHASVNIDMPYLMQGDKVIDNTVLIAMVDGNEDTAKLFCASHMPTKKGPMGVKIYCSGHDNSVDTDIDWEIERAKPLNGRISFTTDFMQYYPEYADFDTEPITGVGITIRPSNINFGNDIWDIASSRITYIDKILEVNNFEMVSQTQSIRIDGTVGDADYHSLDVELQKINLIDIFETLDIDKALIGGYATGTIHASRLLSDIPEIVTHNLHVDEIGYNRCTLGDADIEAYWDTENSSFQLDADITEPGGLHSRIYGYIKPATEELDINFDAQHVKVGFMQPFMEAFASNISGYASGKARLFGTFKYIDLEGDIFAEDLRLRIDFTNTYYSATDSIHLTAGLIKIKDITITDEYGNTALLNGVVTHKYFKDPSFDFAVTNARNFLSYDVTPETSPIWYGRIFGNGSAFVKGEPGVVDIRVDMATAPNSTFTFVLSDTEFADEYSFITFRERPGQVQITDSIIDVDSRPYFLRDIKPQGSGEEQASSDYRMDIQVDITPDARIVLVMDPVGGDEIRANGNGNLQMKYSSLTNMLTMYGVYTLEKGTYNFTLQDIIIKDFTISEGSSVSFNGSPYDAQLDIKAIYNVNANLSDLDESFLQDKELNRTNVPVHALLMVKGSMTQPDISFDLEFPTLTSDTYRKVRSIISTEDMMSRQIIYLLALNRFYTPDYMNGTKGNALFSVASSTISSQISSMLGKLSENWSIAPNLRSERGDFSDLEVDVALSSSLLNNRLIINGNFGYRDKSLNTNQFVGDFDTELLLNKRGTWRLKGYNHYNDQNLYLRTATTTQGLGLMFRRDYDGFLSFLRRAKSHENQRPEPRAESQEPTSEPTSTPESTSMPEESDE